MVCQPEASACMLWGSHMNNDNGYLYAARLVQLMPQIAVKQCFVLL